MQMHPHIPNHQEAQKQLGKSLMGYTSILQLKTTVFRQALA